MAWQISNNSKQSISNDNIIGTMARTTNPCQMVLTFVKWFYHMQIRSLAQISVVVVVVAETAVAAADKWLSQKKTHINALQN